MTTLAKKRALRASGTLNPHPEAVRSDLFKMDFFDPCDRAQVKYEMLRAHAVDEDPVAEACRQFGFSRESFYQIQEAFQELGFSSFLPGKRGRQGPVKLKGAVLEFALAQQKENPDLDPGRLAALIRERSGIALHRTSVLRGTKKKTALAERNVGEKPSSPTTIWYRPFMKMSAARLCKTWNRLPGRWNAFAAMEWPVCFQASKRISHSSSTPRVFLVLPGTGRETFTARDFFRSMNSLPRR